MCRGYCVGVEWREKGSGEVFYIYIYIYIYITSA